MTDPKDNTNDPGLIDEDGKVDELGPDTNEKRWNEDSEQTNMDIRRANEDREEPSSKSSMDLTNNPQDIAAQAQEDGGVNPNGGNSNMDDLIDEE